MSTLYIMICVSYLVGSLSFAIIVSRMMHMDDPRNYGSQNAGATNVMRSGNKKAAVLTLAGDLLKGLLMVLIARYIFRNVTDSSVYVAVCGVFAVIGHIYPVFFKFKGGKGVATAIGVILGFNLYVALLLVLTWVVVFKLSKISSLSALIATVLAPVYAYLLLGNTAYFGGTLVVAFFVLYKHKSNILRLLNKQEQKMTDDAPHKK